MSDETESDLEDAVHRREQREEDGALLEAIGAFHEHGVFMPSRTIYMGSVTANLEGESGTDAKMAEAFIKNLHVLEQSSHDPIVVIMNNLGGDDYHGLAIYDAIKASPCHVTIVARGYAMSMGSIILQAASERVMGERSAQLIHYGTMTIGAHTKTVKIWADESERVNDWMEQLYLERIRERQPGFELEQLRKMLAHDCVLTAQQSIDLGLADRIG